MAHDSSSVFDFLHQYGIDLRARRAFFHHAMVASEETHSIGVEFVIRNLLHLDKTKGPVELWINCPGGDLSEMWGLIDVIRSCDNPVITVAYGNVSSAACLLLASGTGTRYAMKHASFMWHAGTTDVTDDMHWADAKDRMAWEEREGDCWIDEMARRTTPRDHGGKLIRTHKGRVGFWREHGRGGGEKWLEANEMVSHGVVDEIWS